jgi:hypothetical protein
LDAENRKDKMKLIKYYIKPRLVCGRVLDYPQGFKWLPFTSAHQCSRKYWPTPEDAIRGRISGGKLIEAVNIRQAQAFADEL